MDRQSTWAFLGMLLVGAACTDDGSATDASTDVTSDGGGELYQSSSTFEPMMLGRIALDPPHRNGPNAIPMAERSNLPLTVWGPQGASGPLPVLIWAHGGGSRMTPGEAGAGWGPSFSAAGYVVIAMHHMSRSENDRFRNVCEPIGVAEADCDASTWVPYYESADRPRDTVAVMDSFAAIEREFSIELDETRIAIGGHSGGTNAPLYLAGAERNALPPMAPIEQVFALSDPRPRAFITSSPQSGGWRMLDRVTRPVLGATGAGDIDPLDRASVHTMLADGDKYRAYFNSPQANHSFFNLTIGAGELQPQFREILVSIGTAFLDAYLREAPAARAWLNGDAPAAIIDALAPSDTTTPAWDRH